MSVHSIEFRWALDEHGVPTPITRALRGASYRCPCCQQSMIARMGQHVQHHYAHEVETDCTLERVERATLRRFIALALKDALVNGERYRLNVPCPYCGQHHALTLLENVSDVRENVQEKGHVLDVALIGTGSGAAEVIHGTLQAGVVSPYAHQTPTPLLFPDRPAWEIELSGHILEQLATSHKGIVLRDALRGWLTDDQMRAIRNTPCPVWAAAGGIVREGGETLRILTETALSARRFLARVETLQGLADLVRVGGKTLWLTAARWREVVGGEISRIGGLTIYHRLLPLSSGESISLFYVMLNDTAAIAGRRHAPGEKSTPRIDERFRTRRATAYDIAAMLIATQ